MSGVSITQPGQERVIIGTKSMIESTHRDFESDIDALTGIFDPPLCMAISGGMVYFDSS